MIHDRRQKPAYTTSTRPEPDPRILIALHRMFDLHLSGLTWKQVGKRTFDTAELDEGFAYMLGGVCDRFEQDDRLWDLYFEFDEHARTCDQCCRPDEGTIRSEHIERRQVDE